ncbi:carboxypeptidase regulatory-like domain-containing protein [Ruania alkalisoli]|uniref:Carboxypeptidase regulatory-like domain-containing protein n=1 Tax=Ruania alkalisoli TaxID=2779775 RepID=A0A7M1SWG7_9MICO|nr:carboxypeptidase regulatory-like domain-containing protein [Ruania alkalisoli]
MNSISAVGREPASSFVSGGDMHLRRIIGAGAACVLTGGLLAAGLVPAAAAPADGSITVTVVEDRNLDSARNGADAPLENVQVRFVDAAGDVITRSTDASGVATLLAAENDLVGGQYRVEVGNPNVGIYTEAQILDAHAEPEFAPAVSFVDVADGQDATLSVGYVDHTELGPEGATLYSAVQPDDIWPASGESTELYSIDYFFSPSTISDVTPRSTFGSVYGIGVDQDNRDIYAGAYAKRGSEYGPDGPGAIYRVNALTGATETYVVVPNAGSTMHDMTGLGDTGHVIQDFEFRTAVGREALGDVDVNDDNTFLTTVNMNTDSLVVYPVQEAANPAPIQSLAVPVQNGCAADWAPMALEERDGVLHVGAVCGATMETYILTYDRATDGTLTATGTVLSGNVYDTVGRNGQNGPNLALSGGVCQKVDWRPWNDDVDQECIDATANTAPINPAGNGLANQFVYPQPMLADIVLTESGEYILGFRDRGADQYSSLLYYGEKTNGSAAYANYIATGDVVATTVTDSSLTFGDSKDFYDFAGFHNQAASAGMAYIDGSNRLVTNQMDATGLFSNGIRGFNVDTGNAANNAFVTDDFQKSQGLADLEVIVLEQTQQIGNRVWIDTDEDGIQDPGEAPVEGVQVSLYDSAGELVATTETDENGEYWFDSADGLLPEADYQVRLDRESDFQAGGPLAGTTPTADDAGLNQDIDSNGVPADPESGLGEYVVLADITSPEPGENDHSIDFGFIVPGVSVGDLVWLDEDRDGLQGDGEPGIEGVELTLTGPDGEPVTDVFGNLVEPVFTDEDGEYSFDNLPALDEGESYTVTVTPPVGFDPTVEGAGDDPALDSSTGSATSGDLTGDGDRDPSLDFGFVPDLVSVGDYVWIDADRDGIQDEGEAPVEGVEVTLLDSDGEVVATTVTDADGYYVFTDLPISTEFTIEFPTTVEVDGQDYPLTQAQVGDDPGVDSNPGADGTFSFTTPATGENSGEPGQADDPTIDAGYVSPSVSVGDLVWLDEDRDGLQGDGEPGIEGVELTLTGPDGEPVTDVFGNLVEPVFTDEAGEYSFDNLPALDEGESYTVTVTPPVGFDPTVEGAGDDPALDSSTGSATSGDLMVMVTVTRRWTSGLSRIWFRWVITCGLMLIVMASRTRVRPPLRVWRSRCSIPMVRWLLPRSRMRMGITSSLICRSALSSRSSSPPPSP